MQILAGPHQPFLSLSKPRLANISGVGSDSEKQAEEIHKTQGNKTGYIFS